MPRAFVPVVILIVVLAVAAGSGAHAATPLALGSQPGTMASQAVRTLGGHFVNCTGLLPGSVPEGAQVACARLPQDMFAYFETGVHGRLYGYLSHGTLHVVRDWHAVGNVLEVEYTLPGGTLTVARERVSGTLYAVFAYQGSSTLASSRHAGR